MKSNKKSVSLNLRILTFFGLLSLILIFLVWFMQIYLLDNTYRDIRIRGVKQTTEKVIDMFVSFQESDETDTEKLYEEISKYSNEKGVSFIVAATGMDSSIIINPIPMESILGINTNERINQLRNLIPDMEGKLLYITNSRRPGGLGIYDASFTDINSNEVKAIAYFRTIITKNGNPIRIIALGDIIPVKATEDTLRQQLILISITIIIIAALLSYWLSKSITKPIEQLTNNAAELAKGNYDIHFTSKDYNEISQLSDTLDYTATQLKKADQITKDLIANVSHDLRTPLTMISGYGEVMRDIPGEATPENIQVIIDEANRLTSLVNNMMDISKLQAGAIDINRTSINVSEFVMSIYNTYAKMMDNTEYMFKVNCDLQDIYVSGDNMRLQQVFYNLINNAIVHVGEDKQIIISAYLHDDNVRFEVTDHGEGISEENIPLIWQRYFRIKDQKSVAPTGSGLGLWICKTILELHKAEYGVESQLNKGTTIWFELPKEEA